MLKYELAIAWGKKEIEHYLNDGWEPFYYQGGFFFRRKVEVNAGEQISLIRERPLLYIKTKITCQIEDELRLHELDDLNDENREFAEKQEEAKRIAAIRYSRVYDEDVDDHTSVWGRMGGPDCRMALA